MFHIFPSYMPPLVVLGVVIILGFYLGNFIRRFRLPSLIGFMIIGVLFGESFLGLFHEEVLGKLSFITEISLGLIAFIIGSELKLRSLKQLGMGIVLVILAESLGAFIAVFLSVWALTGNLPMALIFGAMAPASAPAGTVAVIQEYRARGSLTKALYAVVGFDDGLAILIFGFAASLAKLILVAAATGRNESILLAMRAPALEIVFSIVAGLVIGLILSLLILPLKNRSDFLIIVMGSVFLATGIAIKFNLSLILTNMAMGIVLTNTRRESLVNQVTESLSTIMPFIFLLFFALAGAHLNIIELPHLGILGVIYILARSAGLIGGARIGSVLGKMEDKIKKYIGFGILSQAGVAIGLALIVNHELRQIVDLHPQAFAALIKNNPAMDPINIGTQVITVITATCIVFEVIGPILCKMGLSRSGEIPDEKIKDPPISGD